MSQRILLFSLGIALVALAACGPSRPEALPPTPTRTPMPTFTPTAEVIVTPVDPGAAATAQAQREADAAAAQQDSSTQTDSGTTDQTAGGEQAAPTDTPVPEPATPTPQTAPEVVVERAMNVRGGPGTNYSIVGGANAGDRYAITGKNPAGDWWQVSYNGGVGWLYGPLVNAQNTAGVAVAANIPPSPVPPPPTPVPAPTNTPVPAAPAAPAEPTPTPAPRYKFNIAVVGRCDPNGGVTYVEGRTYVGGVPQSGDWNVAFSYAPDGPVVAQIKAGPHPGYEGWDQGFYSHIIQHDGPREGSWYFWVVDPTGRRISEIGSVRTDGEAGPGKCQQAVIDFDSR